MELVIEDGAGTRSVVPLADEVILGRAPEVTFRLPDRNVSRRHARFLRVNGAVFVEDLGSFLGTHVNGERIEGRRRLREGDVVQIGDYDLALLPADAREGAPPPLPVTPRPSPPGAPPARPQEPARALEARERAAYAAGLAAPPRARARRSAVRTAAIAGAAALVAGTALGFALGRVLGP